MKSEGWDAGTVPRSTPPGGLGRGLSRWRTGGRLGSIQGYGYLAPAIVVFGLLFIYPMVVAIDLSFRSWDGFRPLSQATWVGLKNYRTIFGHDVFLGALGNTLVIAVVTMVLQALFSFVIAYSLWYFGQRLAGAQRAIMFFPTALAMVLVGLLWKQILALEGPFNAVFNLSISWFGSPDLVIWVIIWMLLWQYTGWSMMIFYAALVAVPQETIEAARLDGVGDIRMAWLIVLPLVRHATALVLLLTLISAAQTFDTVWVTTRGGPDHASDTITVYAYWAAFVASGPGDFGRASAVAVVAILSLMVVAVARIRLIRLEVE